MVPFTKPVLLSKSDESSLELDSVDEEVSVVASSPTFCPTFSEEAFSLVSSLPCSFSS